VIRPIFGSLLALVMLATGRLACALTLTSPDVRDGATLATTFTLDTYGCTGENRAPRLAWSGVPAGTQSFALTMVDSDAPKAGGFVHWLVLGIPASSRGLTRPPAPPARVGRNDFGAHAYGGPCPPAGDAPHHYHITLLALDANIAAESYAAFAQRRRGHVLAVAHLTVLFGR
jgi:Raf kinase inhibitor-like YbhB/YbcL family protein